MRVTVLRNEFNQGYGGNQKVGYSFAIREGFDFVAEPASTAMQITAPEESPKLVAPLRDGRAHAGVRQPHDAHLRRHSRRTAPGSLYNFTFARRIDCSGPCFRVS